MRHDVAGEIRVRLGNWSSYELVTDRRGAQVWRMQLTNGAAVAVKIAEGGGEASVLPAREAAVIRAAGPVAGTVLAWGRLPDRGSWLATPWWHGPTLWAKFAPVRRTPDAPAARHFAAKAAAEAATAVADLHDAGWAHGDLQADHIIHITEGARLLDLSWAHNPNAVLQQDLAVPYAGALVHLEAPETARLLLDGAPTTPTAPADVYALAAVLWQCWTSTWPVHYEAAGVDPAPGNVTAKRQAIASGRHLHPITSLPWGAFGALLARALSTHPDHRPTAREMAGELALLAKEIA